jgi:hypothetical protein
MVFEPVGSARESLGGARKAFEAQVREVKLDRTAQLYTAHCAPAPGAGVLPDVGHALPVPRAQFSGGGGWLRRAGAVWQSARQRGFRAATLVGGMATGSL